jgi:sec-independent protein translocase protein TatA
MTPVVGEIIGWEFLLVIAVIALLFGGSKLPKLAKSMGQASHEFRKGLEQGDSDDDTAADPAPKAADPAPKVADTVPEPSDTAGDPPGDA